MTSLYTLMKKTITPAEVVRRTEIQLNHIKLFKIVGMVIKEVGFRITIDCACAC